MTIRRFTQRTDQTYEVLRYHITPIAENYGCDYTYIHNIKEGKSRDPYPKFRFLFRCATLAGAPVGHWIDDLQGIILSVRGQIQAGHDLLKLTLEKMSRDNDAIQTIISSLSDKNLTRAECHAALAALDACRQKQNEIEQIIKSHLARLNDDHQE